MIYEVIREIKNECGNNQMRDVFFDEIEISDPDEWIRKKEGEEAVITPELMPGGRRYHVNSSGMISVYTLTEAE